MNFIQLGVKPRMCCTFSTPARRKPRQMRWETFLIGGLISRQHSPSELLYVERRLLRFSTLLKFWCCTLPREGVVCPPCRFCFDLMESLVFRVNTLNNQETAMDLVKRVLGDYSREVVLLLSGTNTAFQVKGKKNQCLELPGWLNLLPCRIVLQNFCRLNQF